MASTKKMGVFSIKDPFRTYVHFVQKKPGHAIKSTPLRMNPSIFFSYTVGKGRQGTSSTLPSIFDLSTRCLDSFVVSIFVLLELVGLDKYQYRRPRYKKVP